MLELVLRNYWCPGMPKFVLSYVVGCDICAEGKSYPEKPVGKSIPNPIPVVPWLNISVDFITSLPEAQGYNAIFVVCNHYSKQVYIIPTTSKTSSLGLTQLYYDHIWRLHGLPNSIISDCGPQFAAAFMKVLNKLLGITTKLSMAYHPQTDGQTGRMNQEIDAILAMGAYVSRKSTSGT
jgi:hypothetical protein